MSLFTTHTLTGIVAGLPRPSSFLLDTFFPLVQQENTEEIHFDVLDGNRRIAPFVSPLVAGKVVQSEGVTTKTFKPAYIKDKRVLDPNRPLKRAAGEQIGGELHPGQRIELMLANELEDQIRTVNRRLEVMASEALRLDQVTVSGEGYPTQVVQFGRHPGHTVTLTAGDRWGETGVQPLKDLDEWALMVMRRSGARPNTVVMDPDAWNVFKADDGVQSRLDTRRVNDARLRMAGPEIGGTLMGTIDGFMVYVYAEWYIDPETGEELPVLPSGTVILGSRALEGAQAFGAILDEGANYRAMPYFPKSWTDEDPSHRYLMTQSAPMTVPTRLNAAMAATVL